MQYDAFKQGGSWLVYKLSEDSLATGDPLSIHESEQDARLALIDLSIGVTKDFASPEQQAGFFGTHPEFAHGGSGDSNAIADSLGRGESVRVVNELGHESTYHGHGIHSNGSIKYSVESHTRFGSRTGNSVYHVPKDQIVAEFGDVKIVPKIHKGYVSPKPVGIFSRVKGGVDVFKGSDGLRLMFIVTSNSYEDRDDETIATPALKSYVDKAWSVEGKCLPDNEALFWHGGDPIGDVVWTDMEGPFLYEVIKERPNAWINISKQVRGTIKAVWDFIESNPQRYRWGASHGFKYLDSAFNNGVYKRISKFETSVLPLDAAANPYTFAGVINDMNRDKVLDDMTKIPGLAGKFRKGIRQVKQELDKLGLEHKAVKDETVTKGLLDDMRSILTDAFTQIGDVPDGFEDTVLQQIISTVSSAPDDGMDTGVAYNQLGDDPVTDTGNTSMNGKAMPEHGKALAEKEAAQVRLLDRLITSQGALAEAQISLQEDSANTLKALESVTDALKPVAQVVTTVYDIENRLKSLEDRLKSAPRRAALASETVIDEADITKHAKEMFDKGQEELFPGTGIKIKKG